MAQKKFLSYDGFKYFINKAIGKTDISAIGDGTVTGAISELNNALATNIIYNADGVTVLKNGNIVNININYTKTISEKTWTTIYKITDENLLPNTGLQFPVIIQKSTAYIHGLGNLSIANKDIRVFFMEEVSGCNANISYII